MKTLATIGYEGTDIERFVSTLHRSGIQTLIDVRALPLSRKRGFSKNALRNRIESEGMSYLHFKDLGDPKPGRDAARAGRYSEFRHIYSIHLRTPEARQQLLQIVDVVSSSRACLLCFERDPATCHRAMVADHLATLGITRLDLFCDATVDHGKHHKIVAGRRAGQGLAAA
jgi:uncharacterized protein (DUF488 family)